MYDPIPQDPFFALVGSYLSPGERLLVRQAYELARRAHGDQQRRSGEPFFSHPLSVATYLAQYRLDGAAVAAALLHDVAEDTRVSVADIEEQFGAEVAQLVDGVTKLKDVSKGVAQAAAPLMTPEEIGMASLHKLFEAMIRDVRVVIIKLFDRLHNMSTIAHLPAAKQTMKAEETLAVYAPLANRLGMWQLKNDLEGLALEVLDNKAYTVLKQQLDQLRHEQRATFDTINQEIVAWLTQAHITVRNVLHSPENIYTSYQAITKASKPIHSIDHTLRLVVLLEDAPACYLALGRLHELWRPVPHRFDDYIAVPRNNLYRALHTAVMHSSGHQLKIRLRTVDMYEVSEIGVLAKWVYANTPLWSKGIAQQVDALLASIQEEMNQDLERPGAGVQNIVEDLFRHQIVIYSPRGDIFELPQGATPLDFAYTIHSEVGNHCRAALVNDNNYPLDKPLQDGDQVRILTADRGHPHRQWLNEDLDYLTTSRARTKARRWFRRLSRHEAIEQGQKVLEEELYLLGHPAGHPRQALATLFGFDDPADLYAAIGRAELLPVAIGVRVLAAEWHREPLMDVGGRVRSEEGEEFIITQAGHRRLRLCQACRPRPGHSIIGLIRTVGNVTIHREGCHTLRGEIPGGRFLKLAWGAEGTRQVRLVRLRLDVFDRKGLLFEIARLLHEENVNIKSILTLEPHDLDGQVVIMLELEVVSPRQLVRILHRTQALTNVCSVRCLPAESPVMERG